MKQVNHLYNSIDELTLWLHSHKVSNSILIQIFSGKIEIETIQAITQTILQELPQTIIIGTTTSGEILEGKMHENSIIISMSIFENTILKSVHYKNDDSEIIGKKISNAIVNKDTKCLIMFADGLKCNGDAVLRGINKNSSNNIIVAGGMSGDNGLFRKTYCIHGNDIFEEGIVAVSLTSPDLEIFHTYNLSWKPIGKKMLVTKSKGNIIYELDNQPVKDIYAKYLGKNVVKHMPASTIEFPLIMQEGELNIARSMISLSNDEGIIYAGEVPEGKKVRFGIGSHNIIKRSAHKNYEDAINNPIEGLFIYSCIARKAFLGKALEKELLPLAKTNPLSGYFTYGEFYHSSNTNKLMNVTTTILGLSETRKIKKNICKIEEEYEESSLTINALMNLVEVTLEENKEYSNKLIEINKSLKLKDHALNASANGIIITDISGKIKWLNKSYSEMIGYSEEEALGKDSKELVNSGVHKNSFFEDLWNTILSNKVWHGEITNRKKDGSLYIEENTITPMTDENGVIEHFVGVKQDISERKKMQEQISQYAFYDTLTKIPNRRLFSDRLLQVKAISNRNKKYASLLFLDLDNFKPLNDTYGHKVGDLLLIEVSRRITALIRDMDTVARFGGDEFVILLSEASEDKEISIEIFKKIAEKILQALSQAYFLTYMDEHNKEKIVEHHCSASIGVTLFIGYEDSEDEILKRADKEMYLAKEKGRNNIQFSEY